MNTPAAPPAADRPILTIRSDNAYAGRVAVPTGVSLCGVICFVAGAMQILKFNIIGEIFGGELLLPLAAIVALRGRWETRVASSRPFLQMFACIGLMLVGYVVSDLATGTPSDMYVKGWGRILVLASNVLCLSIVVSRDRKNLWWFVAGIALGGIFYLRFIEGRPLPLWKFYYAEPMVLLATTVGAYLDRRLAAGWFGLLAFYSFTHDFRSFGAFCVLFACVALLAGSSRKRSASPGRDRARAVRLLVGVGLALAIAKVGLDELGGDYWAQRRAASDAGRSAALEVGIEAVMRSPIIGHGSWMRDRELAALQSRLMKEKTGWSETYAGDQFNPHSQVLQAWAEGGILGAAFFLWLLLRLPGLIYWLLARRAWDAMTYLYMYYVVTGAWNVVNSPIGAPLRLHIAIVAVCTVLLALERAAGTQKQEVPAAPDDVSGAPVQPAAAAMVRARQRVVRFSRTRRVRTGFQAQRDE